MQENIITINVKKLAYHSYCCYVSFFLMSKAERHRICRNKWNLTPSSISWFFSLKLLKKMILVPHTTNLSKSADEGRKIPNLSAARQLSGTLSQKQKEWWHALAYNGGTLGLIPSTTSNWILDFKNVKTDV